MPVVLTLAAALIPLLITPGLLFYYDVTPKLLVLLFSVVAALLLTLRRPPRFAGTLPWILLAQAAALLLATVFSTHVALSAGGATWRRFGAVTQLALLVFVFLAYPHLREMGALLRAVVGSGGIVAIYAIFQYFGVDPLIPAASYHAGVGEFTIVRPPGTLGHADYLAGYLLFVIFAAFHVAREDEARAWRVAALCVGPLCLLGLLLTGTRAGLVGLVAGAVWMAFRQRNLLCAKNVLFCIVVNVIGAGFYASPLGVSLRARMHWIHDDPRGGARLLLWRDSVHMALSRPLLGYGPDTFGAEFPRFQSVALAQAYPDFYHESPHNIFLDAATEQGVFGLAALLALVAAGLREGWRARAPAAKFIGAAFVAMLVSAQFSAFTLPTAFFFFLAVAILAACNAETSAPASALAWRVPPVALVAVFVWFGVRLSMADAFAARMQAEIRRHDHDGAIADYASARRWAPASVTYDLYYSRAMAKESGLLGREAFTAALRACRSPEQRQNAFYNLALFYASQNDVAGTERSLRASIAAAPNWFKPHWTLARLLEMTGRRDEARRQASAAIELDGNHDSEVSQTLKGIVSVAH